MIRNSDSVMSFLAAIYDLGLGAFSLNVKDMFFFICQGARLCKTVEESIECTGELMSSRMKFTNTRRSQE